MTRNELTQLIRNQDNSGVAFMRDSISADRLAAEMAALLNRNGGHILLGVEDDRRVSGLTRGRMQVEEWVIEAAQSHLQPDAIPSWETIQWDDGKLVGVVSLPEDAPDKPYKARREFGWVTTMRVGTATRDATREEEARLYQQSGQLQYELKPVPRAPGTAVDNLDWRRLHEYFTRVLAGDAPSDEDEDTDAWNALLSNLDLATASVRRTTATIGGVLLFGKNPKRWLPQSGIRAICYPGEQPDYATRADEDLRGPMAPLRARDGLLVEPGLVDQAWDFVRRNTTPTAWIEGLRRIDRWEYPEEVVREAVANALIHRDYSIVGTDVMLAIYSNRLEVVSPGRLPNTVTTEGMKLGARHARNQLLVNVMRDYEYVDARGMGVRNKLIPGMKAHNGTEPDLIEEEYRFTVRLWKEANARAS